MITIICLAWVGFKLHAPIWYFVLLTIGALIRTCSLGINLGKIANK